jgi:hypothetical protein
MQHSRPALSKDPPAVQAATVLVHRSRPESSLFAEDPLANFDVVVILTSNKLSR